MKQFIIAIIMAFVAVGVLFWGGQTIKASTQFDYIFSKAITIVKPQANQITKISDLESRVTCYLSDNGISCLFTGEATNRKFQGGNQVFSY